MMSLLHRIVFACLLASALFACSEAPAPNNAGAETPQGEDEYAPAREIIADINRIVTPEGVDETFEATLGGARQVVNVRGADRDNPVLLFIHGGPGAVEMPIAWSFQRPWEDYFTVVQWDQRGAGRSFPLNDPDDIAPTLTLERYRDDAIELINLLREKYGKEKVFVLGHSWGSAVGLALAAERPDLLHAYIGMGQIIDMRENERAGMAWTLEQAKKRGDADAVRDIEALAPYPDGDAFIIDQADGWRKYAIPYGALAAGRADANFYLRAPRLSPLYGPQDRQAWADGSLFTVTTLWPRLASVSFMELSEVETPVIFFLGRHDYMTPSPVAAAWLDRVAAPEKTLVWFENSAHLPMVEEPGRVFAALLDHALPLAEKD